jgi:predicted MPP superfamily phosphohydrolase
MSTDTAPVPAATRPGRSLASIRRPATLALVLTLLFGVPWLTLVLAPDWPTPVLVIATLAFVGVVAAFPFLMVAGHGRRRSDAASVAGDTTLGAIWILFVWSIAGNILRLVLQIAGVAAPDRSRISAYAVIAVAFVIGVWGHVEAMRTPRVRRVDVRVDRLAPGLDGLRVVLLTDTHYGPIDRARWSRNVTAAVNRLAPDVVCHTGDIADGTVEMRREQAAPLGDITAGFARVYVTGNHEYYGNDAQTWLDHMGDLGWEPLHNRHIVIERGGDRIVFAGVDDYTAKGSGREGHGEDHAAALAGADPSLPVVLLAHQPKQIDAAVASGVDLQISGHTHGGQIWPFHFLVRIDQPVLQGLSRHGERTQLYTSRGTGFWGPPFRVFAPSEITLITLRAPELAGA